jgi:hypothetical protein
VESTKIKVIGIVSGKVVARGWRRQGMRKEKVSGKGTKFQSL